MGQKKIWACKPNHQYSTYCLVRATHHKCFGSTYKMHTPKEEYSGSILAHGKQRAEEATPNNTLFIENLPHETSSMMLQVLFQQYPGFREARMIEEAKPGTAFVEFEDESLQGFKLDPQHPMAISFAKK